jgi:hypothetical protein
MPNKAVWFVIRDEDVDKVMAAVNALNLRQPDEDDVGGFLMSPVGAKLPGRTLPGGPTLSQPRLPGGRGGIAGTLDGTGCGATNFGSDGHCSDCGADA